jgi:hypothetical protein
MRQPPVHFHVIPSHAGSVEAFLKHLAAAQTTQAGNPANCPRCLRYTIDDEPGLSVLNDLGD